MSRGVKLGAHVKTEVVAIAPIRDRLQKVVTFRNDIYSRDSLMRPPMGLSQKWSLCEVVALVKGYFGGGQGRSLCEN